MKIKDIMNNKLVLAGDRTTIYEAAVLMKKHDIGFLPILSDTKILGVITDRDIIVRCVYNKARTNTRIIKYSTNNVISINHESDINDAIRLMGEKQIKRLLVVDNNNALVGVISLADIARNASNNENLLDTIKKISKLNERSIDKTNHLVDDFKL